MSINTQRLHTKNNNNEIEIDDDVTICVKKKKKKKNWYKKLKQKYIYNLKKNKKIWCWCKKLLLFKNAKNKLYEHIFFFNGKNVFEKLMIPPVHINTDIYIYLS